MFGVNAIFGLNKYLIGGGLLIMVGMGAYIGLLKYQNVKLEKSLVEIKFQNELLKEEVLVQKQINARQKLADALSDERGKQQDIETEDLIKLLEQINEFPEDECAVGDAIRHTLERLSNDTVN